MKINDNAKKYLIYIRYLLPIVALIVVFAMLFVPSFRFIFSGKAGEQISTAQLVSNSWDEARNTLFGTEEQTNNAIIFSRTIFAIIIVFALIYIFALCVSIWSAVVAFRCFLSDNEEEAEKGRRLFVVFCPNRIVLFICEFLGMLFAVFPYCMRPIYGFIYSEHVVPVLEAPDAFWVGIVLFGILLVLSIISAIFEKQFGVDIFKKDKKDLDEEISELNAFEEEEEIDMDQDEIERIKNMFNKEKDNNK